MLLLVAALLTLLTQPVQQRPRIATDLTYDPARDQATLRRPTSWCASLRPADPLLKDARASASSRYGLSSLGLLGAPGSPVSAGSIQVVRDQRTCETAARRYDLLKFGGGSTTLEDHPAIHAVIVIVVGDAYLVEDATERGTFWVVAAFDHDWNALGSYGEGA